MSPLSRTDRLALWLWRYRASVFVFNYILTVGVIVSGITAREHPVIAWAGMVIEFTIASLTCRGVWLWFTTTEEQIPRRHFNH